ncbi:MAG TPA: neutral/alkaline non-lysosomal ceramidase N-terminal domain-containing protein [Herpetosiphonaceae bacterium]
MSLTPAIGTWLMGFAGRAGGCTSIRDELYATALVLDDGCRQLVLISCDLLAIHPDVVAATRACVREAPDLAEAQIMVCCTHTHSGPPGYATPCTRAIDRAYVAALPHQLTAAVRRAWLARMPARLGYASGHAAIGINRRKLLKPGYTIIGESPAGPVDHSVAVVRIDRSDGSPLATIVNFACHPIVLGPENLAVSADFIGSARTVVEAATRSPMLYVQGACGDINPIGGAGATSAACDRLGALLGAEIVRVYDGIRTRQTAIDLVASTCEIELPLMQSLDPALRPDLPRLAERMDKEFPWSARMGANGALMEVQTFEIGDLGIVGVAAEPFAETGLMIKQRSPFASTLFAGYTNGCTSYVPTERAYAEGGYEVLAGYIAYRLSYPLASAAEPMIVRACIDALHLIHQQSH